MSVENQLNSVPMDDHLQEQMRLATKDRLTRIHDMRRAVKKVNALPYPKKILVELEKKIPRPFSRQSEKASAATEELRPKVVARARSRIETLLDELLINLEGDAEVFVSEGEQRKAAGAAASNRAQGKEQKADTVRKGRHPPRLPPRHKDTMKEGGGGRDQREEPDKDEEPLNKWIRSMSVGERELVATVFRFIDQNGDGVLDFLELKEVFKALGVHTKGKELNQMIRQLDADGDGGVSLNEFMGMIGMARLGLIGNGIGSLIFNKMRSILDMARAATPSNMANPPLHSIRRKSESMRLKGGPTKLPADPGRATQEGKMLLDWRTPEEIKQAEHSLHKLQAQSHAIASAIALSRHSMPSQYRRSVGTIELKPMIVGVSVSRPSLLEGTDIPSPRIVPVWKNVETILPRRTSMYTSGQRRKGMDASANSSDIAEAIHHSSMSSTGVHDEGLGASLTSSSGLPSQHRPPSRTMIRTSS